MSTLPIDVGLAIIIVCAFTFIIVSLWPEKDGE